MRRLFFTYVIVWMFTVVITVTLHAQDSTPGKGTHPSSFDQKIWKEVVGATDYSENVRPPKKKRKGEKSDETSDKMSSTKRAIEDDYEGDDDESFSMPSLPINSLLLNVIVYAIVAGLIGYILFIVIRNIRAGSSARKVELPQSADQSIAVENIQELEIDSMLRNALAAGNYRLAIRIYFLGLLKKLDSGGHIRWKKDKTNRDYLSELYVAKHYFEEVQRLTLDYEQVWYGEHELTQQHYREVITSFETMDQKLKLTTPREQE